MGRLNLSDPDDFLRVFKYLWKVCKPQPQAPIYLWVEPIILSFLYKPAHPYSIYIWQSRHEYSTASCVNIHSTVTVRFCDTKQIVEERFLQKNQQNHGQHLFYMHLVLALRV